MHCLTVAMSSWMTTSTHLIHGPLSFTICFLTMASNARSGVNKPVLDKKKTRKKRPRKQHMDLWAESIKHRQTLPNINVVSERQTWSHECSWWRSLFHAATLSHQTPSDERTTNESVTAITRRCLICETDLPRPARTLTSSKGKRSWKMRLILAPPESWTVSTWSPEPSIIFSKSSPKCWISLDDKTRKAKKDKDKTNLLVRERL